LIEANDKFSVEDKFTGDRSASELTSTAVTIARMVLSEVVSLRFSMCIGEVSRAGAISRCLVIMTTSRYVVRAKLDILHQILIVTSTNGFLIEPLWQHTSSLFLNKVILGNRLKFSMILCSHLTDRVSGSFDEGVVFG